MQSMVIISPKTMGRSLGLVIMFCKSSCMLNFYSLFFSVSPSFNKQGGKGSTQDGSLYRSGIGLWCLHLSSTQAALVQKQCLEMNRDFAIFFITCKMLGMFKSNSNQSNREQEIGETFIPLETALFPLHFYRSIDVFCLLWHQKQLFQTSGIFLLFTRAAYIGCESKKMDFSFKTLYHCYQQDSVTNTTFS